MWQPFGNQMAVTLAEVWIEIPEIAANEHPYFVTLRKCGLKLWLNVYWQDVNRHFPLRKCGLKSVAVLALPPISLSLPFAEVWIEMVWTFGNDQRRTGHFPCGSVD